MTLDGGRGTLYSALKTLQAKWDSVDPQWQDAMKAQFAEQVLEPLCQHTTEALQAIDQMQVLLGQMRRECEGISYDIHAGD